jgi:tRNA (cytidine56-2'-O)-methyltransferase
MYLHPWDADLARRIDAVGERWGGTFALRPAPEWRRVVREFPGPVVHLTMYGLPLERVLPALARTDRLLVVVGGAKVPSDLYRLARYNVAVGHQPHSEVAALAVTLARLRGIPDARPWPGARAVIVPQARGKKVRGGRA